MKNICQTENLDESVVSCFRVQSCSRTRLDPEQHPSIGTRRQLPTTSLSNQPPASHHDIDSCRLTFARISFAMNHFDHSGHEGMDHGMPGMGGGHDGMDMGGKCSMNMLWYA